MASRLFVLCTCVIIFMAATNTCVEASVQFKVGGSFGWHEPAGNNNTDQFYIQWAERNRFQVGDALGKLLVSYQVTCMPYIHLKMHCVIFIMPVCLRSNYIMHSLVAFLV